MFVFIVFFSFMFEMFSYRLMSIYADSVLVCIVTAVSMIYVYISMILCAYCLAHFIGCLCFSII